MEGGLRAFIQAFGPRVDHVNDVEVEAWVCKEY